MNSYVATIHKAAIHQLAYFRIEKELEIAEEGDLLWVRGINGELSSNPEFLQLPIINIFRIDEEGRLFTPGKLTPVDVLKKEMSWQTILQYMKIILPVSSLPGRQEQKTSLHLRPSSNQREGIALKTDLEVWKHFAETASTLRLNRLEYAVSEQGKVFIIGTPLPPLPGIEYWNFEGFFLPTGFELEASIASHFVQKKFNEDGEAVLIFEEEGHLERISKTYFTRASRSSIRSTNIERSN